RIEEQLEKLKQLEKRRQTILTALERKEVLSPELRQRILRCFDERELEDLYQPYKSKRRTRAQTARDRGLEGLAREVYAQSSTQVDRLAKEYLSTEVHGVEEALAGARDIIAEWISEDPDLRGQLRELYGKKATISSTVKKSKKKEADKYRDYFSWSEPLARCPAHRFMAMRRGADEGLLQLKIEVPEEAALTHIFAKHLRSRGESAEEVRKAAEDSFRRLIDPSLSNEFFTRTKEAAEEKSIEVFAENLRQLLLAPPLGPKRVLAVDPGYRSGCKVVCLDERGSLLEHRVIFPHPPAEQKAEAARVVIELQRKHGLEAVAVGDGTAGRETEEFLREIEGLKAPIFLVNEDGASVYSASKLARREFPDHDVTVRGAVSIGRRLTDPLSELVKIDPKSIGVGQYQHDVDQKKLKKRLQRTVESCVNLVGVNLNTAGASLLSYVSGLGPNLAERIVEFRARKGSFTSRQQLREVSGLGAKAFQQAAGFLRIPSADQPLEASAVHPESYPLVERIAQDMDCRVADLMDSPEIRKRIDPAKYRDAGEATVADILLELEKPGRDPRPTREEFRFAEDVHGVEDLREGMWLPGRVSNLTRFGAFVDIGVKQDGLLHVSEISESYVRDPAEVLKIGERLEVRILQVEPERGRISLSLKRG
ncbi:MAG TPA: RNA-binding transcriptional accessory protein, partial [Sediminispirochaeta sp.]|nr:RNA-binding transcriptional accessory protein [Sediminispirochaeta sp.]